MQLVLKVLANTLHLTISHPYPILLLSLAQLKTVTDNTSGHQKMANDSLASEPDVSQPVSLEKSHEQSTQTDSLALGFDRGQALPSQTPQQQGEKSKSTITKAQKARIRRFENRKASRLQVKRLQQYLGLAQTPAAATGTAVLDSSSTNLDASTTNSDSYAILISVDCEAYEYEQDYITEIGVSVLDTRDIIGVAPGSEGENWVGKIKSRHFRTKEHKYRRNKRHVQGCPDNFSFGQSEWISERDASEVLRQCFRQSSAGSGTSLSNPCKVVFVGHNVAADEQYLARLGFDLSKEAVDVIDSEAMAMAVFRETFQSSLGKLLLRYDINGEYFHNAGNDAHYTLQLAIAIALREFHSKKTGAEWKSERDIRLEAAIEKAKRKIVDEFDGKSGTNTSNDTSEPAPELEKVVKIKKACKEAATKVFADFEGWSSQDDDEVDGSAIKPISYRELQSKIASIASNKRKRQESQDYSGTQKNALGKRAKLSYEAKQSSAVTMRRQ